MEGYAAPHQPDTLETTDINLNFSVVLEPCRPRAGGDILRDV
jgi:hypothetical protein